MSDLVVLIPARGGSEGIPGKNLRVLAGKPLLWYAIHSAQMAVRVTRLIVSTDSPEIAQYASSLGAEAVFHPSALSGPDSPTFPVVRWNLQRLRAESESPLWLMVLRATSPLRTSADIDRSVSLLESTPAADSVVSVGLAVGIHPSRLKRVMPDGQLVDAFESEGRYPRRRQEFEPLYIRNGALYAMRPSVIDAGGLWGNHCLAYVMPEERSININTEFELRVAELLLLYGSSAQGKLA